MRAIPVLMLMLSQVGLGLAMGRLWLRGERRGPWLIGLHLLLGISGLEALAMLQRGTPDGDSIAPGGLGTLAMLLVAAALLLGLSSAILRPRARRPAELLLAAHAGCGAAGVLALLVWLAAP